MKNFLVISKQPPMPDQASGDLRFFSILEMLGEFGHVTLAIKDLNSWSISTPEAEKYKSFYIKAGINLYEDTIHSALNSNTFDAIIFEFYYSAYEFLDMARYFQPQALLVVDSVDVHFNRLQAKAELTNDANDQAQANLIRAKEITTYSKADVIITVSEDDKSVLQSVLPKKYISVLSNVHVIHEPSLVKSREHGRLIFIGGFSHSPNIDAVWYFLNEIMPLIRSKSTEVKLSIIGSNVPQEILDMASIDVEVIGYVEDTAPYLQSAYISIAPLRYGGGMKGKVGEAMSHGLPVVTTRFGAEGFGLTAGKHLLVENTPESFAEAIFSLLNDKNYYALISNNGYEFIKEHYAPEAMQKQLIGFLEHIKNIYPIKIPWHKRVLFNSKLLFERHIGWRLERL